MPFQRTALSAALAASLLLTAGWATAAEGSATAPAAAAKAADAADTEKIATSAAACHVFIAATSFASSGAPADAGARDETN